MKETRIVIRPFIDEGLGNSSYLVASTGTGRAAVIDPQRDVHRYLQVADGMGLHVSYALDTHLHADFVSGARELAARGAGSIRIGASAGARLDFDHLPLAEGDHLSLGDVSIGVIATPGHTPEHISFTVVPAGSAAPDSIFTGGALIVGGAARTDLLGEEFGDPLARQLYRTLHDKLMRFPDEVQILPTHGGGSFCAAPSSEERTTTIGKERRTNRFALASSEEQFVRLALAGLPSYPAYYRHMRDVNRRGPRILGGVPLLAPLSPQQARQSMQSGAAVIDIRSPREFAAGHVPDSYGIPLGSSLSTWVGWVVPFGSPVVLVADDPVGREEAILQLIRIGYDELRGYLEGGIGAWRAAGFPTTHAPMVDAEGLHAWMRCGDPPAIVDVRFDAEWRAGHLPEAVQLEPGRIAAGAVERIPRDRPVVIHCGSGNRAMVALSLLERFGYRNLTVLDTGFGKWREAGYDVIAEAS
jgi:hydroxyacylglutathione hydrolase